MTIKASGRAALMLAAGLFVGLMAGPGSAAANGDDKPFLVAADQLSDTDRTLQESSPAAAGSTNPSPTPAPVATAASDDGSAWNQASLIGKVFIGCGALLTVASAARLFMT